MLVEARRPAVQPDQGRSGAAGMAGDRLGVKAPVGGAAIFALTGLAHGERRHRRIAAIVGNALDDAKTRPAMRAIGKGIAEAALEQIDDFLSAGLADRGVRRDLGLRIARKTLGDPKFRRQRAVEGASFDLVDPRQRRRFALKADDEILDGAWASPDADQHALGVVENLACKVSSRAMRQTVGRNPTPCTRPRTRISMATNCACLLGVLHQRHGAAFQRSTLLPQSPTRSARSILWDEDLSIAFTGVPQGRRSLKWSG